MKKSNSILRIQRLFNVHKLLRNGKSFSAEKIAEYLNTAGFETNERTVARDIQDLRELGADISGHRFHGYQYQEPFSLLEALEGVEYGSMNEVLALVRQMGHHTIQKQRIEQLLINLERSVRDPKKGESPYIQFEKVELTNLDKLDIFYKHIIDKRVLDIQYLPFGALEPLDLTIMPIVLREYNNRWTLIAFCKQTNSYQNYPIDRIISEKLSTESLSGESNFNPTEHFKNVIGNTVLQNLSIEKIIFKVNKNRAYYVETKKWHNSQFKVEEDENSMTFSIEIIPNREFWAKIMEHLEDIDIISPEHIKEEFKNKVRKVYERLFS